MNILDAIKDPNLCRRFLADEAGSLKSWSAWAVALRCLYGLPLKPGHATLIKRCTGRTAMPRDGFDKALFLVGRRSGKSRISAVVGAYEAALSGKEKRLAAGELGMVAIIAPTTKQSRIIKSYIRAIFEIGLLQGHILRETKDGFELSNGVLIEILTGDFRTVRGYTLLCAVIDEVCFFGLDQESKVKNDSELVKAILPSLATTGGKLVAISSPYAKRGWAYSQFKHHFGNELGRTLVWNTDSRTMNPTLSQSVVDDALAEDYAAAQSEYLGKFRDDVIAFLTPDLVEIVVKRGRTSLMYNCHERYFAFVDVSGGRGDGACLGIAHKKDGVIVVDRLEYYKPPHNPVSVIGSMSNTVRDYGLNSVCGDNYSAEFVNQVFNQNGIRYNKSAKPKSQLYLELLPMICSQGIELPDNDFLIKQLCALERRTRSGGKDIVDHPQGGHDDVANCVAGLVLCASEKRIRVGAF